jgi:thiamine pyrophosphokinase
MKFTIIANAGTILQQQISNIPDDHKIIALDGIADQLLSLEVRPFAIIGDFDSISVNTLEAYKAKKVLLSHIQDQNSTDLDKGIKFCDENYATEILIINAFGGERVDHTLINYRSLRKHYSSTRKLRIREQNFYLELYKDCGIIASGTNGSRISLLAFPKAIITSDGLEYNMNQYTLELGYAESSSNSLKKEKATINIKGEILLIYDIHCQITIR